MSHDKALYKSTDTFKIRYYIRKNSIRIRPHPSKSAIHGHNSWHATLASDAAAHNPQLRWRRLTVCYGEETRILKQRLRPLPSVHSVGIRARLRSADHGDTLAPSYTRFTSPTQLDGLVVSELGVADSAVSVNQRQLCGTTFRLNWTTVTLIRLECI